MGVKNYTLDMLLLQDSTERIVVAAGPACPQGQIFDRVTRRCRLMTAEEVAAVAAHKETAARTPRSLHNYTLTAEEQQAFNEVWALLIKEAAKRPPSQLIPGRYSVYWPPREHSQRFLSMSVLTKDPKLADFAFVIQRFTNPSAPPRTDRHGITYGEGGAWAKIYNPKTKLMWIGPEPTKGNWLGAGYHVEKFTWTDLWNAIKPFVCLGAAFYKTTDPVTGTVVERLACGGGEAPQQYPAGTITALDPRTGSYRIAIPVGTTLGAADTVTHTEVASAATAPGGVTQVTLPEFQAKTGTLPWYRKPWVWAAAGGGALILGGGAYYVFRRKRS